MNQAEQEQVEAIMAEIKQAANPNPMWRPYSKQFKNGIYFASDLENAAIYVYDAKHDLYPYPLDVPIDLIHHRDIGLHHDRVIVGDRCFHRPFYDSVADEVGDRVLPNWSLAMTEAEAYRVGITQQQYDIPSGQQAGVIRELVRDEDGRFSFQYLILDDWMDELETKKELGAVIDDFYSQYAATWNGNEWLVQVIESSKAHQYETEFLADLECLNIAHPKDKKFFMSHYPINPNISVRGQRCLW